MKLTGKEINAIMIGLTHVIGNEIDKLTVPSPLDVDAKKKIHDEIDFLSLLRDKIHNGGN